MCHAPKAAMSITLYGYEGSKPTRIKQHNLLNYLQFRSGQELHPSHRPVLARPGTHLATFETITPNIQHRTSKFAGRIKISSCGRHRGRPSGHP